MLRKRCQEYSKVSGMTGVASHIYNVRNTEDNNKFSLPIFNAMETPWIS